MKRVVLLALLTILVASSCGGPTTEHASSIQGSAQDSEPIERPTIDPVEVAAAAGPICWQALAETLDNDRHHGLAETFAGMTRVTCNMLVGRGYIAAEAPDLALIATLVVAREIPEGTQVDELLAVPGVYLSSEVIPERFLRDDGISSISELSAFGGMFFARVVLPGEQLHPEMFDMESFDLSDD